VVLVGMPGSGKSTVGVLLAKRLGRDFLDTDLLIQSREGMLLREIIEAKGHRGFCRVEGAHVRALSVEGHVIATGGSVVYDAGAMEHLRRRGLVVFLHTETAALEERLGNLHDRGVVLQPGQTLASLADERLPLYRRWCHIEIACRRSLPDRLAGRIAEAIRSAGRARSDRG
jgi:shikimate kinase